MPRDALSVKGTAAIAEVMKNQWPANLTIEGVGRHLESNGWTHLYGIPNPI